MSIDDLALNITEVSTSVDNILDSLQEGMDQSQLIEFVLRLEDMEGDTDFSASLIKTLVDKLLNDIGMDDEYAIWEKVAIAVNEAISESEIDVLNTRFSQRQAYEDLVKLKGSFFEAPEEFTETSYQFMHNYETMLNDIDENAFVILSLITNMPIPGDGNFEDVATWYADHKCLNAVPDGFALAQMSKEIRQEFDPVFVKMFGANINQFIQDTRP